MIILTFDCPLDERTDDFNRTISVLVDFMRNELGWTNVKIASDDKQIEISSVPSEDKVKESSNDIAIEMMVLNRIYINKSSLDDSFELDKVMSKIRHFVSQAKNIDDYKYKAINKREKEE